MVLQAGENFGHYEILAHIAQGGTGDVYRATDTRAGCEVALKIPSRSTILDPRQFEDFLRELEALGILQHPFVQHKLENGNEDGTPYLATELITGKSLRSWLKANGSMPLDEALPLACKIAEGLEYCHQQNVVHRDIKPENIIVTPDNQPIIIDFGLSLSSTRPTTHKTAGTPDYMAPEQIEGRPCDKRTDIYALGATFYEMLTGKAPFVADDPVEVMNMHLYQAVPRLDRIRPEMSLAVATVVAKCLQRDPDLRYPNMQALIHDLTHLAQVDTSQLDALCITPPQPGIFHNEYVRAILMSIVVMIGIVILGFFLAALKH